MLDLHTPPPLSLYIHIPWCTRKCPYCDFNSHAHKDELPEQQYVGALLLDLEKELPGIWGRSIESVFIGGGTPSLFRPESIDLLLSGLRALLSLRPNIEITMEANPGSVERQRLQEFQAAGINRLSLGIQSFDDDALLKLGRVHNSQDAHRAIESAQQADFDSVNLDLMYGLPNQDQRAAISDLQQAMQYQPQHISHYQLTLEPNTAFYNRPPALPADDTIWQIQTLCQSKLAENNYYQYEVSAYSRPNHRCQHNLNYWMFGDYLGIGAGAHQKLTSPAQRQITRSWKKRLPEQYINGVQHGDHIEGSSLLKKPDLIFEFMLNALRLSDGVSSDLFYQRTGLPLTVAEGPLKMLEDKLLLNWTAQHIKPTAKGFRYLNDMLMAFLDDGK